MIIGVAGAHSAPTAEERQQNLDKMNEAAAVLLQQGHTPLIGVNAALPVIEKAQPANVHEAIMRISLAVIDQCEALLMISDSPGADMERMLVLAKGLPVYYRIEDIPDARL